MNRIIDELKCFDVQPRAGTLPAGSTASIRLAYSYTSRDFDGAHTLPVLLRVAQGKQFWLELQGRTLAPTEVGHRTSVGGWVWRDDKCVCVAQTDLIASQLRNSEGRVELASRRTDLVASQLRSTGQLHLVAMPTEPLHN